MVGRRTSNRNIEETLCFMGEYFGILYLPASRSAWTPITEGRRNDLIRI